MKAIRLTKPEVEFIRQLATETTELNLINGKAYNLLDSILGKFEKAESDSSMCMITVPIFQDILKAATTKCASIEGTGYPRAIRQARQLGLTDADKVNIQLIGQWVDVQKWLLSVTILDVFSKWSEWLPKAKQMANQNKPRIAGLGAVRQSITQPSTGTESRPKAQGFR